MSCRARCLSGCGNSLRPAFKLLGSVVGRWPKLVILGAFAFIVLCGCGCIKLRVEYDFKYWLNTETESYLQNEEVIQPHWPQKDIYSSVLLVAPPSGDSDPGILSAGCLQEAQRMQQSIKDIMPSYCHDANRSCENSIFTSLGQEGIALQDVPSFLTIKQKANNGTLPYQFDALLGKSCCNNAIVKAEAMFLRYTLVDGWKDTDEFGNRLITLLESWSLSEHATKNCPALKVFFATHTSFKHAMDEAMVSDQRLVSLAIVLMIVYLSAILGRSKNCVNSKVLLGLTVILSVIGSLVVSLGIGSMFDLPITQMTFLAFFVLLGVGVDDALIINDAFARTDASQALDERLATTLEEVGPSVLLTSATDFAAFLVGLTYAVPSLRWFCIHAAIAVFTVFVFQVTLFSACLILDARRSAAGRCDVFPCLGAPSWAASRTDEEPEPAAPRKQQLQGIVVKLLELMLRPLPGGIIVLLFLSLLGLSTMFLATHAEKGGGVRDYVPDDHHIIAFWEAEDKYVGVGGWSREKVMIYSNPIDLSDTQALKVTQAGIDAVATSSWVIQPRPATWVDAFLSWRAGAGATVIAGKLREAFLASPGGSQYSDDVLPKDGDMAIARATIWCILPMGAENMNVMTKGMRKLYKGATDGKIEGFVWSAIFMSCDRYENIDNDILKSFAYAMVSIALVCFVLLPPVAALSSLISIVLVNVDLMGFLSIWGVPLNLAQAAMLVLALGFSVDYSAHIAEGFNVRLQIPGAKNQQPAQIMLETLKTTGLSVLNAGMSTVLATAMLSIASTVSFRRMFKNFFLMTLFGLLHGLVFLPIVLVFITTFARRIGSVLEPVTGARWSRTAYATDAQKTVDAPATEVAG